MKIYPNKCLNVFSILQNLHENILYTISKNVKNVLYSGFLLISLLTFQENNVPHILIVFMILYYNSKGKKLTNDYNHYQYNDFLSTVNIRMPILNSNTVFTKGNCFMDILLQKTFVIKNFPTVIGVKTLHCICLHWDSTTTTYDSTRMCKYRRSLSPGNTFNLSSATLEFFVSRIQQYKYLKMTQFALLQYDKTTNLPPSLNLKEINV